MWLLFSFNPIHSIALTIFTLIAWWEYDTGSSNDTISKVQHAPAEFFGALAEYLFLDKVDQFQPVTQGFIRVENPFRVHLQKLLLVLLHHLRE